MGAPAPQGGPPVFQPPPITGDAPQASLLDSEAEAQFKSKKRMIIAGARVFGLAYYGALVASSVGVARPRTGHNEYAPGLIPIVGPFVTAVSRAIPDEGGNNGRESDYAGMGLYLGLGVAQIVGASLFIVGLRMPTGRSPDPCRDKDKIHATLYSPAAAGADTPPYRPCSPFSASVQPIVTPTFAGAGFTGTF